MTSLKGNNSFSLRHKQPECQHVFQHQTMDWKSLSMGDGEHQHCIISGRENGECQNFGSFIDLVFSSDIFLIWEFYVFLVWPLTAFVWVRITSKYVVILVYMCVFTCIHMYSIILLTYVYVLYVCVLILYVLYKCVLIVCVLYSYVLYVYVLISVYYLYVCI